MTKTRLILLAATSAALLALPGVGGAQSTPGAAAIAGDQPGMWTGRAVEYAPNGISLIGEAEILQGQNRLRANRINMTLNDGALTRAEAVGGVYFVTPQQTMRGDRATYDIENDTLTVTGDVILNQGKNVATGGRLVYNLRTEAARWEGGSNGRVQGVFYPRGN